MEEIKFKKEFEDKLNELGIKERFLVLFIASCKELKHPIKDAVKYQNMRDNWISFICGAFLFPTSERDFWVEISKK